jgi:glycosyltransferase involved in cell wall biosynthesis
MKRRICLVTTGQPSTNPRLVKEADALVAAGHVVHVIGARRADWADASDRDLLASSAWTSHIIDSRRHGQGTQALGASVRHRLAKLAAALPLTDGMLGAAVSPVVPELTKAATGHHAHLYIAHNLGALVAASTAAATHRARLGFDAEDFHSGQCANGESLERRIARQAEERFLSRCDYVTASAPGIADQYAALTADRTPVVILNVFPLASRPDAPFVRTNQTGPWRLYWFSQTIGRDRGIEDAIAAIGRLPDLDIELHLRGEWQADYEGRIRALALKVGLRPGQLVGHPPASAAEMVRLAASYDLGLALETGHSINNDLALSNKIFTYLLAGVPVLATATTGQQALAMSLGAAARTVPTGDVAALAAALRSWLTDPQALATARQAAWALGERRLNWDLEQQKFLSVVDRVLGTRPASGLRLAEMAS